ncbi:flagellar motor protein MotB [Cryobacterium sp. Hh7]|uniref:OmpA/MotB family protein n=1 Tax=Cryobacterium sp. Hh7 TaxID=1259159 RepID=UPI0021076D89|nr:flagellar motor protein MotB [Cryobacterium sp. Hh7]
MSTRRRRPVAHVEDEHPDERWMASYMDMVTVLMCMFIVLFAMSTVDEQKFEMLRESLATGFGNEDIEKMDVAVGNASVAEIIAAENAELSDIQKAMAEVDRLIELREQMRAALDAQNLSHLIDFNIDERGLTVGMIGSETFFEPNLARLSDQAVQVLNAIAPALAVSAREISVEGHADPRGVNVNFETDWELSGGRATAVLRYVVESGGVTPALISAVGFGSSRPSTLLTSTGDSAANRRVDLVVMSDQPENIRALIPTVIESQ